MPAPCIFRAPQLLLGIPDRFQRPSSFRRPPPPCASSPSWRRRRSPRTWILTFCCVVWAATAVLGPHVKQGWISMENASPAWLLSSGPQAPTAHGVAARALVHPKCRPEAAASPGPRAHRTSPVPGLFPETHPASDGGGGCGGGACHTRERKRARSALRAPSQFPWRACCCFELRRWHRCG